MKNFDSRTYSINDFVEWDAGRQLELNPRFQRRAVWSEKAKSYLIDTVLRGKPIAKFFIRQQINVTTKTSIREVVDGQQRLRTILSFIKDGFRVSRSHNPEYGGQLFSHLHSEVQGQILAYEVSVDLLINLPDSEVLDIFNRLNSYAVILNEQEKINAAHFGPFKLLADKIGQKYNRYWTDQAIFTANQIVRMQEINLVADLLIALLEGIKSKKQISKFYATYEKSFDHDTDSLESLFDSIVTTIERIYPEGVSNTEFHRPVLYYTLFVSLAQLVYGLPISSLCSSTPVSISHEAIRNRLERIEEVISAADVSFLSVSERQFRTDASRATTDEAVRKRRSEFLVGLMS